MGDVHLRDMTISDDYDCDDMIVHNNNWTMSRNTVKNHRENLHAKIEKRVRERAGLVEKRESAGLVEKRGHEETRTKRNAHVFSSLFVFYLFHRTNELN